jgi:hypothetical protein
MSETTPTAERIEKLNRQGEERNEQRVAFCDAIRALKAKARLEYADDVTLGTFCGEDFEVPKELLPMALALVEACAMHWERKGQGKETSINPPPPGMSVLVAKEGQRGKPLPKTVNAETTLTVKVKDLKPGDVLTCLANDTVESVEPNGQDGHRSVFSRDSEQHIMPGDLEVTIRRKEASDA